MSIPFCNSVKTPNSQTFQHNPKQNREETCLCNLRADTVTRSPVRSSGSPHSLCLFFRAMQNLSAVTVIHRRELEEKRDRSRNSLDAYTTAILVMAP